MSDKPSALERLSTAISTSDLTVDLIHRCDADYILALAYASHRHGAVASPLMRLHLSGTHTNLKSAYNSVLGLVKRLNMKKNWRLHRRAIEVVAVQALSHHVAPVCPHCSGRKFEMAAGAPVLSTKVCKHCGGTGRRPIQKKYRDQIAGVITSLEQIDSLTQHAVARLVR